MAHTDKVRNQGNLETRATDKPPAQKVDPTSYHSFIDLTTPHHDAKPGSQSSRGRNHRRVRKSFEAVDRPGSFLDLGESDVRILYHPSSPPHLSFENACDTEVVGVNPPSVTTSNCEEQGKKGGRDTNGVGVSPCNPTSIGGITGQRTSHSARSALQTCDLTSNKMAPYSLRAPEFLEYDRLPCYEEVTVPTPVGLGEKTIQQSASKCPGSSYRIGHTKRTLPSPSHDPKSCAYNPAVVLPARQAHRAFRPLPLIPSSKRTHARLATLLDAEQQSLHVDDLNIAPPKSLSKMEKALLRKIEFGPNLNYSETQLS